MSRIPTRNQDHQAPPDGVKPDRAAKIAGSAGEPDAASFPVRGEDSSSPRSMAPRIVGRRYHLYSPSIFYIVVTIFIGIGAFNAQNNLLFFVFGVTLATLIVSGVVSGTMMMGVSVRRVIEGPAEVGKPARILYRVTNLNRRLPLLALRISEWGERPASRRKWRWRVKRARAEGHAAEADADGRLGPVSAFAAFVPGGGSILVPADASPLRAGVVGLRGFEVSTVYPFGIARKSVRVAQPGRVTIRQPLVPMSGEALVALESSGRSQREAAQASRGEGEEFFGIREYSPGDPMRLIAWRASARSGDLRTRVQAAPPRASVRLVLDLDGLDDAPREVVAADAMPKQRDPLGRALSWPLRVMGFLDDAPRERPPTLSEVDRALSLAGSLAVALLARGFAVELAERGERFAVPLGGGARQRDAILDTLAQRRSGGDADGSTPRVPSRAHHNTGLTLRLVPSASADSGDGRGSGAAGGAATTGAAGSARSGTLVWSYDRLDASISADKPVETEVRAP